MTTDGSQRGGAVPEIAGVVTAIEAATVDLQRLWDECLAELGSMLTLTQFRVLVAIDRRGPLRLGDLAREVSSSPSPTSKVVDRLEQAGFVARLADRENGRAIRVALSSAGAKFAQWTHQRHRTNLAGVIAKMDPSDVGPVTAALETLHEAMEYRGP